MQMRDFPFVRTKLGPGRLFRIAGANAYVEFDYMYLVKLPVGDVDLAGVDLGKVEVTIEKGDTKDEG